MYFCYLTLISNLSDKRPKIFMYILICISMLICTINLDSMIITDVILFIFKIHWDILTVLAPLKHICLGSFILRYGTKSSSHCSAIT
jgi:hypothetical protein